MNRFAVEDGSAAARLDPSDFPALGSQHLQGNGASAVGQAPNNTYASQVNSASAPGLPNPSLFTNTDFPVLGGRMITPNEQDQRSKILSALNGGSSARPPAQSQQDPVDEKKVVGHVQEQLRTLGPEAVAQPLVQPAQQVLLSPADKFGLVGLVSLIRMGDPDRNMISLGTDLNRLGLDVASRQNMAPSLITPWSDSKTAQQFNIEPSFKLPSCYNVQPPPANIKVASFQAETLFFIFYTQPGDALQQTAAKALYQNNWRYHKELRLWLTKEPNADQAPPQKNETYERGMYTFFDPSLWEKVRKEFVLVFESIERPT